MGPEQAHQLLERSFAQFQADRSVVGLVRGVERGRRMLGDLAAELGGDDAPILEYARLRAEISARERSQARASRLDRRKSTNDALSALRRGDIIAIGHGRRVGLAVVLEPDADGVNPRPLVLTEHRWAGRISSADYSGASARLGSMTLPKRVEHRQPRVRRDVASALLSAAASLEVPSTKRRRGAVTEPDVDPELARLRERMRTHPTHQSPEREAQVRAAERYLRIERDNAELEQKIAAATNSLARTFDRIVKLLMGRGFIEDVGGQPKVTEHGTLLARIYSESDLLVAECLRDGAWADLDPAGLAAVVSSVVFESRGDTPGAPAGLEVATQPVRRALVRTRRLWTDIHADEQRHHVSASREPDVGFVAAIHSWATLGDLSSALAASDTAGSGSPLSAGDFVRWCRQVLDLLDQVRIAAPTPESRATAKRAIAAIRRGVVAVDAG
jgi:ATP-dependent RNA helicase HelY